ncbi:MAG: TlpA family protein disulfide reductase [Phycisphaerae bacterium]
MTRNLLLGLGLIIFLASPAVAHGEQAWNELNAEFTKAMDAFYEKMQKLSDGGDRMMFDPTSMPKHPIEEFRPKFRTYAEAHEGKPEAVPALTSMLVPGMMMMGQSPDVGWALDQLTKYHADTPDIEQHFRAIRMAVMSAGEDRVIAFLEAVRKKSKNKETRGEARIAMAEILVEESPMMRMMGGGDRSEKKARGIEMLKSVAADFAGTNLGERADRMLFAFENLRVGKKAPELVGKNADGEEVRLSQFKGNVVAIVFWATWCKPCIQMIPHEREMVKQYKDRPFTMLGINSDGDVSILKKTIKREKINWPTIFDGAPDTGKIVNKWRVQAFPTIFIIDHEGVFRHTQLAPFQLDSVVADLVAKAEKAG